MLYTHLLIRIIIPFRLRIQAQIPRHQARSPDSGLGIDDAMPPLGRLHELGVLLLQDLVVLLRLPVPGAVGSKHQVHFLEGALVGFGVQGPDNEDGECVDGAENVEGLFVELGEHGRKEQDLLWCEQV